MLADEPTGNLDQRTSRQIFNILKEESKTKLVIVVSHNLIDAENFADRIIELFEGKILHDYTKTENYNNEFTETENYVILPHHKDMTNKEVESLNNLVKEKKIKIKTNLKLPSKEVTYLRYILDSRYIPVNGELIKNKRNDWRVKITIHDH